jgi:hypothetical protein
MAETNQLWSASNQIEFTQPAERVLQCKHCLGGPGEYMNLVGLETP